MKALKFSILVALALLGLTTLAVAQSTPLPSANICNSCTASLSVTNAGTDRVALPSTSPPFVTVTVYNGGSKPAYFVQGGSTVVATTSGIRVDPGSYVALSVNGTYIAAITSGSDTTTLTIYQSNGLISFGNSLSASSQSITTFPGASSTTPGDSTITVGGTFQTIAAASTSRKSLDFVNVCNVGSNCTTTGNLCYLYIAASGTPTTANSIPVVPGQEYIRSSGVVPSDAIQATCDGTGDHFALKVQ